MRKPPLQDVIVKPHVGSTPSFQRSQRPSFSPPAQVQGQRRVSAEFEQSPVGHAPSERPVMPPDDRSPRGYRFSADQDDAPHSRKWLFIALGIGAVVVLCAVALSLMFAGATVTVYPKQDTVVVNTTFVASADTAVGAMPYERITVERTATRNVPALGESAVEERATGNITIYNEYSDTPQRLIKRTRFESSAGKIYRITNAVEVPGKKSDGTPGSIEVSVTAEEPGESYNITGADTFTVPGFEGTPQEGLVYAKSTTDFVGGFVGVKRTVDEADRSTAVRELEQQLRDELFSSAFSEADQPDEYHLSKEALFYEFTTLPDESVEADQVTLSLSGKLHGILFDKEVLARLLARNTVASYNGEPIRLENIGDVSIRLEPVATGTEEQGAPWQAPHYTVRAEGKAHFIWQFDEQKLSQDLAGQNKDVLMGVSDMSLQASHPGIDRIQATVRPFWKQTFPEDAEDIVIITKLDE